MGALRLLHESVLLVHHIERIVVLTLQELGHIEEDSLEAQFLEMYHAGARSSSRARFSAYTDFERWLVYNSLPLYLE